MVGLTDRCGHLHNGLAWIPASNGLRYGSDLGLIPDVEWEVGYRVGLSRVGLQSRAGL